MMTLHAGHAALEAALVRKGGLAIHIICARRPYVPPFERQIVPPAPDDVACCAPAVECRGPCLVVVRLPARHSVRLSFPHDLDVGQVS